MSLRSFFVKEIKVKLKLNEYEDSSVMIQTISSVTPNKFLNLDLTCYDHDFVDEIMNDENLVPLDITIEQTSYNNKTVTYTKYIYEVPAHT